MFSFADLKAIFSKPRQDGPGRKGHFIPQPKDEKADPVKPNPKVRKVGVSQTTYEAGVANGQFDGNEFERGYFYLISHEQEKKEVKRWMQRQKRDKNIMKNMKGRSKLRFKGSFWATALK